MKNKLSILTAALLMPLATNTFAADAALSGAFKTIKNVTVSEITPMVINGLHMTGGDCTVTTPTIANVNWPGDQTMLASTTGTATPAAGYGQTTGPGCATGTSTLGIYEVDGASGADIVVTVTGDTAGGITFAPAGCVVDYDGAANGETCTALADGVASPTGVGAVTLANSADEIVSAGNGQPVAGKSMIALGGQVTSAIGLSAATAYVVPFDITVTY